MTVTVATTAPLVLAGGVYCTLAPLVADRVPAPLAGLRAHA